MVEQWIAALRSGKYAQTRNVLKDEVGYCCLGVACDISGLGKWDGFHYSIGSEHRAGELPTLVRDALGLRACNGSFREGCLTNLNDSGKTFAEIADIIESRPKGLFKNDPKTD